MISNDLLKNKILDAAIHGKLVDNDLSLPAIDVEEVTEDTPFDIPSNWKWTKLSNVFDVKGGKRIPKGKKFVDSGEHIYIRVADMENMSINTNHLKYIDEDTYGAIKNYIITENDLYITVAGTIGSVGSVPNILNNMNLTENADRLIPKGVNKEFYKFVLNSQYYQSVILSNTTKAAQPKLAIKRINDIDLVVPPLEEQQRIVDKIEELFDLVDRKTKNDQEKDKLKILLKDKILDSAIHGDLVGNNFSLPAVDAEEVTEDIPFDIPSNWRWLKLKDCTNFNIGKTPPTKDSSYWSNDVPWVSISDMKHRKFINSTSRSISSKAYSKVFDKKIVPAGTLLMSFKLTIGRLSVTNIECVHNEAIVSLYPKEYLLRDYLLNALDGLDLEKNVKSAIKGKTLNSKSIAEIMIPIPPLEEQQQIVTIIEECFDLVDRL